MSATIDGTHWVANPQAGSVVAQLSQADGQTALTIAGVSTSGQGPAGMLTVVTYEPAAVGTYALSQPAIDADLHRRGGGAGFVGASTRGTDVDHVGTLTITTLDLDRKWLEGTFTFDAIDRDRHAVVEVRDGSFGCALSGTAAPARARAVAPGRGGR